MWQRLNSTKSEAKEWYKEGFWDADLHVWASVHRRREAGSYGAG